MFPQSRCLPVAKVNVPVHLGGPVGLEKAGTFCGNQVQTIGMEKVYPVHATSTGKSLLGTVVIVPFTQQIRLIRDNVKGKPLNTRELSQDKVKWKQRFLYLGLFCSEGKTYLSHNNYTTSHLIFIPSSHFPSEKHSVTHSLFTRMILLIKHTSICV